MGTFASPLGPGLIPVWQSSRWRCRVIQEVPSNYCNLFFFSHTMPLHQPMSQIESVITFLRWLMSWWLVCGWSVVVLDRHGWMQMSMTWSKASALKGSLQNLRCPFEKLFSCLPIWKVRSLKLHTSLLLADPAFTCLSGAVLQHTLHDLLYLIQPWLWLKFYESQSDSNSAAPPPSH